MFKSTTKKYTPYLRNGIAEWWQRNIQCCSTCQINKKLAMAESKIMCHWTPATCGDLGQILTQKLWFIIWNQLIQSRILLLSYQVQHRPGFFLCHEVPPVSVYCIAETTPCHQWTPGEVIKIVCSFALHETMKEWFPYVYGSLFGFFSKVIFLYQIKMEAMSCSFHRGNGDVPLCWVMLITMIHLP